MPVARRRHPASGRCVERRGPEQAHLHSCYLRLRDRPAQTCRRTGMLPNAPQPHEGGRVDYRWLCAGRRQLRDRTGQTGAHTGCAGTPQPRRRNVPSPLRRQHPGFVQLGSENHESAAARDGHPYEFEHPVTCGPALAITAEKRYEASGGDQERNEDGIADKQPQPHGDSPF